MDDTDDHRLLFRGKTSRSDAHNTTVTQRSDELRVNYENEQNQLQFNLLAVIYAWLVLYLQASPFKVSWISVIGWSCVAAWAQFLSMAQRGLSWGPAPATWRRVQIISSITPFVSLPFLRVSKITIYPVIQLRFIFHHFGITNGDLIDFIWFSYFLVTGYHALRPIGELGSACRFVGLYAGLLMVLYCLWAVAGL